MRKTLVVLILTMSWFVSNGQLYPPIQPYQENDYSLSQVKRFAMAQTELSSSWRREFLSIVNDGLAQAGESMYLGEDKILSALDHVIYERRNLNYTFENSRNILNQVKFYPDFGFDGMVATFKYGKCSLVVFKTRCMNLLKCRIDVVQQVEIKPEPKPEPVVIPQPTQPAWSFQSARKVVSEEKIIPDFTFIKQEKKRRTWAGRNIVPIIVTFVATSTTIYVVANRDHHHEVTPPVIDPRTMPPGIPSKPVVPTPGVPADPRTMPPGTSYLPHTNFGGGVTLFRF
jgi:hypothetical protein